MAGREERSINSTWLLHAGQLWPPGDFSRGRRWCCEEKTQGERAGGRKPVTVEVSLFELQLTQLVVYPVPFPLCRMSYHLVQRGNELGPNDGLLISPYPTFPGSLEVKEWLYALVWSMCPKQVNYCRYFWEGIQNISIGGGERGLVLFLFLPAWNVIWWLELQQPFI